MLCEYMESSDIQVQSINNCKPSLSVTKRPDCWYGRECKTQLHNNEDARKYNYMWENIEGFN